MLISCWLTARTVVTYVVMFVVVMLSLDCPNDRAIRPIPAAEVTW
jgi:hypothetical protein